MKTKIKLALLTAMFAGLGLASCEVDPNVVYEDFPLEPTEGGEFAINLNYTAVNSDVVEGLGYAKAFFIIDGKEVPVKSANEGDLVYLRAVPYEGFTFAYWTLSAGSLGDQSNETDQVSFVMPASAVNVFVEFDDTSKPLPTPYDLEERTDDSVSVQRNVDLRAWKAQQTSQSFVWFDSWSGNKDSGQYSMRGLPDETTIISNWGQPKWNLNDWHRADMAYVQQVKGTKVVVTLFSARVGEDVPDRAGLWTATPAWASIGTSSDDATIRPVIAQYARDIYDLCVENGFDGYDWDFEPTVSGRTTEAAPLWLVPEQAGTFLEELSYYFGPSAKTLDRSTGGSELEAIRGAAPTKDMLLLVDGEVHSNSFVSGVNNTKARTNVDYYVQQAYGAAPAGRYTSMVTTMSDLFEGTGAHAVVGFNKEEAISRMIVTENFEAYAETGNQIFNQAKYTTHEGFATGGFGVYRIGLSFQSSGDITYTSDSYWPGKSNEYVWYRQALDMCYGEGARVAD